MIRALISAILVMALIGCSPAPSAPSATTPTHATAPGPANTADLAYCGKLASLYERYGSAQDRRGEDFDSGVTEAINQCHSGNTVAGIATLERRLKDQDISLPPR